MKIQQFSVKLAMNNFLNSAFGPEENKKVMLYVGAAFLALLILAAFFFSRYSREPKVGIDKVKIDKKALESISPQQRTEPSEADLKKTTPAEKIQPAEDILQSLTAPVK